MIAVDIINLALGQLGVNSIVDLDEDSTAAAVARQVYEPAVRYLLSLHNWNFAIKRLLSASVDSTNPEWKYAYLKPSDTIKIITVKNTDNDTTDYAVESGLIYANTSPVWIEYVFYNTDVDQYPPYFVDALVDLLASRMAIRLVNDRSLSTHHFQLFTEELDIAKHTDAQQGTPPKSIVASKWRMRRY